MKKFLKVAALVIASAVVIAVAVFVWLMWSLSYQS